MVFPHKLLPITYQQSRRFRSFLLDALTILKNRGYDSAGLATIPSKGGSMVRCQSFEVHYLAARKHGVVITHAIVYFFDLPIVISFATFQLYLLQALTRFASEGNRADAIDLVRERSTSSVGHAMGIAHTRWATHGPKSDVNSHPHTDASGKIALVHNGTLVNHDVLRRELSAKGIHCLGQTDSEVLSKLIGWYYYTRPEEAVPEKRAKDVSLKEAVTAALNRCDGTWVSDRKGHALVGWKARFLTFTLF